MTDRLPYDTSVDAYGDEPPEPRPERDPDEAMEAREERDRLEREFEERRERRAQPPSRFAFYLACDRAAYERRHGTLDDPADRFRADCEPF